MFPRELEQDAFHATNGELGWTRSQITTVVEVLRSCHMAIIGGELWWVQEGAREWIGLIPQREGPPAVYPWDTKRGPGESWSDFVDRAAAETLAAARRWPASEDLPTGLSGRILYNLTWTSEEEFECLCSGLTGSQS
jgi:hypothetical protein